LAAIHHSAAFVLLFGEIPPQRKRKTGIYIFTTNQYTHAVHKKLIKIESRQRAVNMYNKKKGKK